MRENSMIKSSGEIGSYYSRRKDSYIHFILKSPILAYNLLFMGFLLSSDHRACQAMNNDEDESDELIKLFRWK